MNTPQTRAMAREYFDLIWSLRFISPSITISTTSNNPLSLGLDHKEEFHSPFYIYSAKQANPVTLSSTLMPTPPNLTKSLLFGIAVILEVLPQSILLDEFGSSSSNSVVRGYVDLKDIQSWTFGKYQRG